MIPACPAPRPPSRPRIPLPAGACDTHAHVFGPAARFPYAADRSYTPPDAPLENYLAMLDTLGFARGVLVQGSAHGSDNSAMLDALARQPGRLRGVAVADADVPAAELRRWHGLGVRGLRFNHFFRGGQLHYRGGVPLEAARVLAPVMQELGWHLQLWIDVKDLPDTVPILQSLGLPVVIDHMGRSDASAGTATPGFASLLRFLAAGGCWVKLSGAHRISRAAPDYPDARSFHQALIAKNPDRLVWGGDWPHPRMEGEMPDVGHLLDLFTAWTPDAAIRQRIPRHQSAAALRFRGRVTAIPVDRCMAASAARLSPRPCGSRQGCAGGPSDCARRIRALSGEVGTGSPQKARQTQGVLSGL
jgi:predicted TIM-barrel fold metal-dependent hydrolase